jgi:hypothetical protein
MESQTGLGRLAARIRRISQHIHRLTAPTQRILEEPEEPSVWWAAMALYLPTGKTSAEARERALWLLVDELPKRTHKVRWEHIGAELRREAAKNKRTFEEERRRRVASALWVAVDGLRDHVDGREGVSSDHPGIGDLYLTDPPEKVIHVLRKTVARLLMEELFLPGEISRAERPGGPRVVARERPESALEPDMSEWEIRRVQGQPEKNELLLELLKQTEGRERLAKALIAISQGADTPAKLSAAEDIEPGNARQIFNRLRKLDRPM